MHRDDLRLLLWWKWENARFKTWYPEFWSGIGESFEIKKAQRVWTHNRLCSYS